MIDARQLGWKLKIGGPELSGIRVTYNARSHLLFDVS